MTIRLYYFQQKIGFLPNFSYIHCKDKDLLAIANHETPIFINKWYIIQFQPININIVNISNINKLHIEY